VRGTASYAKAILDDPDARPYLGPIAFHTWWSETIPASDWQTIADLAKQYDKPVWATEIGYDATAWTSTPWIFPTWQNARRIATTYHKAIKFAGASAALYWQYQDDFPLMSADTSDKYPAYHVVQQLVENFSKGTQIIGASSDTASILALAGKHVTADRFSSQLINTADADQVVTLTGLPNNPITLVRSSLGGEEGKTIGTYTPTNGTLTLTIKAQSVSMLSGKLAAAAPSPGLPAGWTGKDIGYTGLKGSSTGAGGAYTVKGAGIQIAGKADQFHFASGSLSGDGEVVARVASLQNTHANARAGIMIRDTSSASSKEVSLLVTPSNGVLMQWRSSFGGETVSTNVASATAARWLKIGRTGNTFTFHVSADGAAWTQVGSTSVSMASTTLAGLAVTSGNYKVLNTGMFDNVRAGSGTTPEEPPPPPPPPPTEEPSTTLPAGWAGTNVGYNKVSGATLYGNNTFTVKGGGIDIGGTADQFHFANRTLSGSGQVVARLTGMGNTSSTAKAGVMIRESTRADSRMAALMITPTGSLISIVRSSTGSTATVTTLATRTLPQWLKIVRSGSTFTFHASANGTSWTQVGSASISMASTTQAGMGVTSRVSSTLNTSTFDNVAVTAGAA
jgi:regulation of enolase protein 1 (concanavalin A-like superfamily)